MALLGFNLGSVCIILTIDHVNLDRGPGELCCAVAGNGAGVVAAVGRRRAPDPQPGENVLGLHLGADAEIKDNFDLDCLKLFYFVKMYVIKGKGFLFRDILVKCACSKVLMAAGKIA